MTEDNKAETINSIGESLVKSFHEQFAQNQNHHQNLFIQTLTILLSVLVGYGYLYIRVDASKSDLNISIDTLYAYQAIAMFLLSIAIALISNMALGFRRDQLMAANIRIRSGVMSINGADNYFFSSFNPQGKDGYLTWMPEFHVIFFIGLISIKLLLISVTVNYTDNELCEIFRSYPLLMSTSVLTIILDITVVYYYRQKWIKYITNAPEYMK